MEKVNMFVES